jgi:hypothetical protein
MKHITIAARIAAAILMLALFAAPASAQNVPSATVQEILIKTSLLTFNDANITGNYDVFHARLAKPFRDQFPPAKLAEIFKGFRDQHVYLDLIAPMKPISTEATVDGNGRLRLKGYFDTSPNRMSYDLAYMKAGDEWQLININVELKKLDK